MSNGRPDAFFDARDIAVERIPTNVLEKARKVISKIERGVPYTTFRGKRLTTDRTCISIPVGR